MYTGAEDVSEQDLKTVYQWATRVQAETVGWFQKNMPQALPKAMMPRHLMVKLWHLMREKARLFVLRSDCVHDARFGARQWNQRGPETHAGDAEHPCTAASV
jgi:hypothetical protein